MSSNHQHLHRASNLADELADLVHQGLPGAFAYVDEPNGAVRFVTAGVADLDSAQPMMPDSHYRIGSTTKTFTAVVVLQLVAEHRFGLGDLVHRWMDDLPTPHLDELTIEHLLRMRSGLFDFVDHPSLLERDANRSPRTLDEVLRLAFDGPPSFQPGERYAYCNTNFCLLQAIVEQVTGGSLADAIGERILEPLRLRNTYYPAQDDLSLPEPYIRGYDYDGSTGDWAECTEIFCGLGDGAMISTALDLSRFYHSLFDGRLTCGPHLDAMHDLVDQPPPERAYGLGIIADRLPCRTVWGHSGGGFGFVHSPFLDPASGRFVVTMHNGTYGFRQSTIQGGHQPSVSRELRCLAYGPPG